MSNGVNQCAACGDLWDDDEPHVACRSDHGHDPTDEAVALLKSIGLDITYTDEGLRVVARRIMSIGGEDEQNRQYAAQSKNWTAGYEQGVSDERERAAERVAAAYRLAWDQSSRAMASLIISRTPSLLPVAVTHEPAVHVAAC